MNLKLPDDVSVRKTCRLCGGNTSQALTLAPSAIADAFVSIDKNDITQDLYPLDLDLCDDCGLLQLRHTVDPVTLFGDYTYTTSVSLGLVRHFEEQTKWVLGERHTEPGSLVVEIGSNDGTLLRKYKDTGMRVLGVDPANAIALQATESGVETWPEFFTPEVGERILQEHGPASIVVANNVFAHADDLMGMADGIRTILAPDGVFVFEVSYLLDIVENMLFDTVYHEHLCYHSVKPLVSFFGQRGMELVSIDRVGSKGGSLRGLAQPKEGPLPTSPDVADMVKHEKSFGLHSLGTFQKFASQIDVRKQKTNALVDELRSGGLKIAGYGASATATTLTAEFGLGARLDFVVDDNPTKHGTFTPGDHIPVFSSDELYSRRPDYVVILSWNYADPIVARHEKFIEDGGKFIVPLPDLEVRP